jgi:hypothetical protein
MSRFLMWYCGIGAGLATLSQLGLSIGGVGTLMGPNLPITIAGWPLNVLSILPRTVSAPPQLQGMGPRGLLGPGQHRPHVMKVMPSSMRQVA